MPDHTRVIDSGNKAGPPEVRNLGTQNTEALMRAWAVDLHWVRATLLSIAYFWTASRVKASNLYLIGTQRFH